VAIAGQNCHAKDQGAFTGEVSASMLKDAGCTWVILGHSERRQLFHETDAGVAEKLASVLKSGLSPIVCVGETLAQRESGSTLSVVKTQVDAVAHVLGGAGVPVAIAYEPVWAIGTGKNATPADAEEVHAAIRGWLGPSLAARARILYGGSVKPDNAAALLGCPNVDGALIGGASLDAGSFGAIARAAQALTAR
jgi:triosephosphate isomerase